MEEAPADTAPSETPPPPTPAAAPPPPAESEPPPPPPPASEPIKDASDKKESVQEKEGECCDQPGSTRSCNNTLMTNGQLPKCHSPGHDDRPAFQTTREPSIERSKLPTNKAIDFQVRVRVVEGRNISGSNISPVVKVTVSNQVRQTRVKKSTNKPFFDEIFFFNFKIIASELFDQTITFEIFNSRKLRSNAMIGTFSVSIIVVVIGYAEEGFYFFTFTGRLASMQRHGFRLSRFRRGAHDIAVSVFGGVSLIVGLLFVTIMSSC